jgi:hypothetical protein
VECCAEGLSESEASCEISPKPGNELGVTIGYDVDGKAMESEDIVNEELGEVFCRACHHAWDEVPLFGQVADNDADRIEPI